MIVQPYPHVFHVAPHVGAWIETLRTKYILTGHVVAPHVGAWIETKKGLSRYVVTKSHPTWVRGLKPSNGCRTTGGI